MRVEYDRRVMESTHGWEKIEQLDPKFEVQKILNFRPRAHARLACLARQSCYA